MDQATIEAAFRAACLDELAAPKPGNVHVHAAGHRMSVADFERSAEVAAPHVCAVGARLGRRVLNAVAATRTATGQNTNLGILLLAAPIAMAVEYTTADLRGSVVDVIAASDMADAEDVFAAIRLAVPGGLGSVARHDVHAPAIAALPVTMAEAAPRDRIARQWSNGFADVFGGGLRVYGAARARWCDPAWATLAAYLHFLADDWDSHVLRKHGAAIAEATRRQAETMRDALQGCAEPPRLLPSLLEWDATLKAASVNPGTCADLTVATIMSWRLTATASSLRLPTENA